MIKLKLFKSNNKFFSTLSCSWVFQVKQHWFLNIRSRIEWLLEASFRLLHQAGESHGVPRRQSDHLCSRIFLQKHFWVELCHLHRTSHPISQICCTKDLQDTSFPTPHPPNSLQTYPNNSTSCWHSSTQSYVSTPVLADCSTVSPWV